VGYATVDVAGDELALVAIVDELGAGGYCRLRPGSWELSSSASWLAAVVWQVVVVVVEIVVGRLPQPHSSSPFPGWLDDVAMVLNLTGSR